MTAIEFKSALVCDDFRREDTGKLILIGIYSGGLVSGQPLPLQIQPVFYLSGFATPGGHEINFRFMPPSGRKPLANGRVRIEIGTEYLDSDGRVAFGLPLRIPFVAIGEQGLHKFQAKTGDSRWRTVLEINVSVANHTSDSSPIAHE